MSSPPIGQVRDVRVVKRTGPRTVCCRCEVGCAPVTIGAPSPTYCGAVGSGPLPDRSRSGRQPIAGGGSPRNQGPHENDRSPEWAAGIRPGSVAPIRGLSTTMGPEPTGSVSLRSTPPVANPVPPASRAVEHRSHPPIPNAPPKRLIATHPLHHALPVVSSGYRRRSPDWAVSLFPAESAVKGRLDKVAPAWVCPDPGRSRRGNQETWTFC